MYHYRSNAERLAALEGAPHRKTPCIGGASPVESEPDYDVLADALLTFDVQELLDASLVVGDLLPDSLVEAMLAKGLL